MPPTESTLRLGQSWHSGVRRKDDARAESNPSDRIETERVTTLQISDQVGMSPPMIQRYRFMDRKTARKAAVFNLETARRRRRKEQNGAHQLGKIVKPR
jgi:hypothetical protein